MTTTRKNCCWNGCDDTGEYPAPRRRQMPISYDSPFSVADDVPLERDWYCLAHIREFNKGWNFFGGMKQDEIEDFQKDAITGHRRTQRIQPHVVADGYRRAAAMRTGRAAKAKANPMPERALSKEEREALAVFGLDITATQDAIKRRYRELVKEHHPDRIGVDGEEKIKIINQAYTFLRAAYI